MDNIKELTTEAINPASVDLDSLSAREIVALMNSEDRRTVEAVARVQEQIAQLIEAIVEAFSQNGRLIYMGAGTSGRLGVLDASECPPTFGVDAGMVVGLIAGGDKALRSSVESAEDSESLAVKDLQAVNLQSRDVVVGIAASGRTPYVLGGLRYAKSCGCLTGSICCNYHAPVSELADIAIEAVAGAEVLSGSTRLKAGTVQKMILNMLTTGAMIGIGKAYHNLMVDVVQTNEKLVCRAESMVRDLTGVDLDTAKSVLKQAQGSVKVASLMILADITVEVAKQRLKECKGHLRQALNYQEIEVTKQ